jgi:protease-4
MRISLVFLVVGVVLLLSGCGTPKINLFSDGSEPLEEFTLQGKAKGKVLLIPLQGIISDQPQSKLFSTKPSMVQEVTSHLAKAATDEDIKAVVFKVNSPGGSATASDILYHEIMHFKKKTDAKIVVSMMNVAASGGYYISLPADKIMAHPTTITGSVGVVFLRFKAVALMDKIGLAVETHKSGKNKDMGSPFRPSTPEESEILQSLTDELGDRFIGLVKHHRQLTDKDLQQVSSARVYLAREALDMGLVDDIGYLKDAIQQAQHLAGLPQKSKVVVYRRNEYHEDNVYNDATSKTPIHSQALVDLGIANTLADLPAGFYYLWPAAAHH